MHYSFENKVALITGAASGIGKATALLFSQNGAKVIVADHNAAGEETVAAIQSQNGKALFVHCDVSQNSEVEKLMHSCLEKFAHLDFAFNNAGIEGTPAATVECSEENWDRTLSVNLKGIWLCMKHQIPIMQKQGGGAIVNCASVAGLVGMANIPAYVASKHGVVGLTRSAALEYIQDGIRINAICPGAIQTPMIERFTHNQAENVAQLLQNQPIGRLGKPEEIAHAVAWLCSEGASLVTGQALAADGGWTAH